MEPPFILLKSTSWLAVEEMDTLLGAVVKNFWAPTDNSVPKEPLDYNKGRKFVENGFNDFVVTNKDAKGADAKVKLQGIGDIRWKGEVDNDFDLRGKHIRYVKLRGVERLWKDLKEDPEVREIVPEWIRSWRLHSRPPVCLINGVFICENVSVETSTKQSHDRGVRGEALVGTAAALAGASQGVLVPSDGIGNFEAVTSVNKTHERHIEAKDMKSSIFALQLYVISSALFNKQALKLKDKSPEVPAHRQMGEDDESPSMDSLTYENIDPETLEAWE